MIIGIGTDLCDANRILRSAMSEHFTSRVFSAVEMSYAEQFKVNKQDHLAAFFAAKEAFCKALGTGFRKLSPLDISVDHDDLGAPRFVFSDKAKAGPATRNFAEHIVRWVDRNKENVR